MSFLCCVGRRIELRLRRCRGVKLAKAEPFAFYEVRGCVVGVRREMQVISGKVVSGWRGGRSVRQAEGMGGDCGRGVVRLGLRMKQR